MSAPSAETLARLRSLVAAPDGSVVARLGDAPDYTVVDLDPELVERTRKAIPVLRNAREL